MIPVVRVVETYKKREHAEQQCRQFLECLGAVIEQEGERYRVVIRTYRPEAVLKFARRNFPQWTFEIVEGGNV